MSQDPQGLRASFASAESKRKQLDSSYSTNTASYQELLQSAISLYERCLQLADSISLFSPNETLEDVATNDLQYLTLNYYLADLQVRRQYVNRKEILSDAQTAYSRFIRQLDSYDILTSADSKLYEQYLEAPTTFSTASTSDPAARRETKIRRFKEEKELKNNLEFLQQNPAATQNDDALYRKMQLARISFCIHQTFAALESIAQELHILSLAPKEPQRREEGQIRDDRERGRPTDGYSERLDSPLSAGLTGPLLSADGKPMRPFTLLDKRSEFRNGVFRPDHSLPTMTIDEYLEEERRRGGMIEGGGAQSGMKPEPDEDDIAKADEETLKARAWDDYVEANPKGSGNTLNRG